MRFIRFSNPKKSVGNSYPIGPSEDAMMDNESAREAKKSIKTSPYKKSLSAEYLKEETAGWNPITK